ncbi:MAG: rRNA maturation RNase YbeY [Alphaproteobacteria bacterium]
MSTFEYSFIIDNEEWNDDEEHYQKIADDTFNATMNYIVNEFDLELFEFEKDFYCNLILTNNMQIQELNNEFRGLDKPTNVLSFANLDAIDFKEKLEEEQEIALGEIFIAKETLEAEAKEKKIKTEDHFAHLFAHGILHLLGFDHQDDEDAEEMEKTEADILQTLNINNPYEE